METSLCAARPGFVTGSIPTCSSQGSSLERVFTCSGVPDETTTNYRFSTYLYSNSAGCRRAKLDSPALRGCSARSLDANSWSPEIPVAPGRLEVAGQLFIVPKGLHAEQTQAAPCSVFLQLSARRGWNHIVMPICCGLLLSKKPPQPQQSSLPNGVWMVHSSRSPRSSPALQLPVTLEPLCSLNRGGSCRSVLWDQVSKTDELGL